MTLTAAAEPAAEQLPFASWLEAFRAEALAEGISPATLDQALTGLEPIPRVLELDQRSTSASPKGA
jgi:membrane-bound lytic murein transglycosylase B